MSRRSTPTKAIAASALRHTVDVHLPLTGLGTRVNDMTEWCEVRGLAYAMHGHRRRHRGAMPLDAVRFFFACEADARAFHATWGGAINGGPPADS